MSRSSVGSGERRWFSTVFATSKVAGRTTVASGIEICPNHHAPVELAQHPLDALTALIRSKNQARRASAEKAQQCLRLIWGPALLGARENARGASPTASLACSHTPA